MKYLSYFSLIVALLLVFACGGQKQSAEKAQEKAAPQTETMAKFHLADLSVDQCPGCGMKFTQDKDIADTVHYANKVYGFCGPKCAETFKADPEKTLANMHKQIEGMHKEGEHQEESM